MANYTADEIKRLLESKELNAADLNYSEILDAIRDLESRGINVAELNNILFKEVMRMENPRDDKAEGDMKDLEPNERYFSYRQLNEMPDVMDWLESTGHLNAISRTAPEKILNDRIQACLQELKKEIENGTVISPLAIDELKKMASQAGVNIDKEVQEALALYEKDNDITETDPAKIENNIKTLQSISVDWNDKSLKTAVNISDNLTVKGSGAPKDKDKEAFREAVVNNAIAALSSSKEFSALTDSKEREAALKREINAQAETLAYKILLTDEIRDDVKNSKIYDSKKIARRVRENLQNLVENKGPVEVSAGTFVSQMADASAAWDEKVAYYTQKGLNSVAIAPLKARFDAWDQKMEQAHPKTWKYYKMAAQAVRKAAPSVILSGGVMLAAGTGMAVPATLAYGTYRAAKGIKPLLKKYREARAADPNARFIDTLKQNKILASRAVISAGFGIVGISGAAIGAFAEFDSTAVRSAARGILSGASAVVSWAAAISAQKDKKASKAQKWGSWIGAGFSTAFAAIGIGKAADNYQFNAEIENLNEDTLNKYFRSLPINTEGMDEAGKEQALKAFMKEHGLKNINALDSYLADQAVLNSLPQDDALIDQAFKNLFEMRNSKDLGLSADDMAKLNSSLDMQGKRELLMRIIRSDDENGNKIENLDDLNNLVAQAKIGADFDALSPAEQQARLDTISKLLDEKIGDRNSLLAKITDGEYRTLDQFVNQLWDGKIDAILNTDEKADLYLGKLGLSAENIDAYKDGKYQEEIRKFFADNNITSEAELKAYINDQAVSQIAEAGKLDETLRALGVDKDLENMSAEDKAALLKQTLAEKELLGKDDIDNAVSEHREEQNQQQEQKPVEVKEERADEQKEEDERKELKPEDIKGLADPNIRYPSADEIETKFPAYKELEAYNREHGLRGGANGWLGTRSPEDIQRMYDNLTQNMTKEQYQNFFGDMSPEEVMHKYNRLDVWTVRVKVEDGKLVPLLDKDGNNLPRYQMDKEMLMLKQVIECNEISAGNADIIKSALGHIKDNGDTDLSGQRTGNRITGLRAVDCHEETQAYGVAGEPPAPRVNPEPVVVSVPGEDVIINPYQAPAPVENVYDWNENYQPQTAIERRMSIQVNMSHGAPFIPSKTGEAVLFFDKDDRPYQITAKDLNEDGTLTRAARKAIDRVEVRRLQPDGTLLIEADYGKEKNIQFIETGTKEMPVPYKAATVEEIRDAAKRLNLKPGAVSTITDDSGREVSRVLTKHGVVNMSMVDGKRVFELQDYEGNVANVPQTAQRDAFNEAYALVKAEEEAAEYRSPTAEQLAASGLKPGKVYTGGEGNPNQSYVLTDDGVVVREYDKENHKYLYRLFDAEKPGEPANAPADVQRTAIESAKKVFKAYDNQRAINARSVNNGR